MERLEPVLLEIGPDVVLVPGDVNSTLAASLVAVQARHPGRSRRGRACAASTARCPRRSTGSSPTRCRICCSSTRRRPSDNLRREGIAADKIHMRRQHDDRHAAWRCGRGSTRSTRPPRSALERGEYLVVTLHRPALVDGPLLADAMRGAGAGRRAAAGRVPGASAHPGGAERARPRTRSRGRLRLLDPIGYLEFLSLVKDAAGVLTDSGGIQEETTFLGIPCFTLRANTERPVTC